MHCTVAQFEICMTWRLRRRTLRRLRRRCLLLLLEDAFILLTHLLDLREQLRLARFGARFGGEGRGVTLGVEAGEVGSPGSGEGGFR